MLVRYYLKLEITWLIYYLKHQTKTIKVFPYKIWVKEDFSGWARSRNWTCWSEGLVKELAIGPVPLILRVCLDTAYFIENLKHCSKINFKCVNSAVKSIFNIFKCMNSATIVREQWFLSLYSKFMWFYYSCAEEKKKKTQNA